MMTNKSSEIEALREAIDLGQTEKVLDMLKLGVPIVIDQDGQTALHLAASAGHYEMVEALIQAGCDVGIQDFTGHTALQRAAAEGHLDIIKTLVKNGVSVDHQDEVHGNTALHEASWKGFSQSVQYLCKSKANPYIKNRGGFAPLHLCCQNGHNETCRVLLLSGCKPDIKNNYGDTPLHTAARYGHAGVIRILVSAKCNSSEQNKNGDTALHIAAAMGRRKLTRVLLESGCDRAMKNKQNETAVEIAARKNLQDVVQILQSPHHLRRPPMPEDHKFDLPGKSVDDSDDLDAIHVDKSYNPYGQDRAMLPQHQYHNPQSKRERSSNSSQERLKFESREKRRTKPREGTGEKKDQRRRKKQYQYQDFEAMASPYNQDLGPGEFPLPNITEHDHNGHGEQLFMDLAGNIKRGPAPKGRRCGCGPAFHKFEKRLDVDKKDIIEHIDKSHHVLDSRLAYLEKKTKDQIFSLNQAMKESFAQERGECLDRMDRRALRERIAIERQQVLRDMALKRDLALWLDAKLKDIERKHKLDAKNSALLRAMAIKRFSKFTKSTLPGTKVGTLRRAHSEELVSEVGFNAQDDENNDDRLLSDLLQRHKKKKTKSRENSKMPEPYKGLQVSDQPSRRRVRRNSAGDEISSILNHETSHGLIVMGSPLATSETLEESGSDLNSRHYYFNTSNASHNMDPLDSDATLRVESSERASSRTSSSLNTTVVTKVEMNERSQLFDISPEERLDFVVCDPMGHTNDQNNYYNHPGVIRPIPGRPFNSQHSPPPLPGPKPSHLRSQIASQQMNQAQDMADYSRRPAFPLPKDETSHVQRELLAAYHLQGAENAYIPSSNHNLNGLPSTRPQISQFAFNSHGLRATSMKPMLAPLEEVDYVSQDQIEPNAMDFGSKADSDLHRQLLNIPMTSEGSHDSHNDSGYSTRLGFSAGPSPSLSGSRPESSDGDNPHYPHSHAQGTAALLDPMAINLMPPEFELPPLSSGQESRLQDVQAQLQMSHIKESDPSKKFPPKGSLV
ncbi:putative ankyrin repeat domain-containing protein 20A2 [Tigriopus californicus]|uniref:putative ankyrin repeat domain-containing protein 20A2 n=1 Tax=Tigriopus californicus TaxID=6832 RepID=UPI0027DA1B33|nr:putative ankyrin repeat domain-containing protein 20A2 [Tigriopus californicus]